jgi:hypothetical protein
MVNTLYQKQRGSLAHHYFLEFIVKFTIEQNHKQ